MHDINIHTEHSRDIDLKANADKNEYIVSCYQNSGQNHNITIANKALNMWQEFKYLGMTAKNKITFTKKLWAD
jgi:hypothetical protein